MSETGLRNTWSQESKCLKNLYYFSFWISAVFFLNYRLSFFHLWGHGHCWEILGLPVYNIREQSSSFSILGQQKSQERILIGLVWEICPFLYQ